MSDKKIVECAKCHHDFNEHSIFSEQIGIQLDPEAYQIKRFRTAVCHQEDCTCATARVYEIVRVEDVNG